MQLLTTRNPKLEKGTRYGYLSAVLHLAPADISGRDVCPWRTRGCTDTCLNVAGRGGIPTHGYDERGLPINGVQAARIRKTQLFFDNRQLFLAQLVREIRTHAKRALRHGLRPAVRLNGTSDLPWERISPAIFAQFPDVQFYDYTKGARRMAEFLAGKFPANYYLTFSVSESNHEQAREVRQLGGNIVAVTTDPAAVGVLFDAIFTLDADAHDLRFLDPKGVVLTLRPKGRAKRDASGFVVR
jgi:hypothetical protein